MEYKFRANALNFLLNLNINKKFRKKPLKLIMAPV
jgi:hypothetical protein